MPCKQGIQASPEGKSGPECKGLQTRFVAVPGTRAMYLVNTLPNPFTPSPTLQAAPPPMNSLSAPRSPDLSAGFSLVELLCVVAVISLMLGLSASVTSRLGGTNAFSGNVAKVSALIDQARQYAIANNTYVWVAFHQSGPTGSRTIDSLGVAVIASTDGTNPAGWTGPVTLPNPAYQQVNRIEWLEGIKISPSAEIRSLLASASQPAQSGADLSSSVQFRIPGTGGAATVEFDHVAAFSPRGEFMVGPSPVAYADVPLRPASGAYGTDANVAMIQLSGLTGTLRVYRQ